MNVELAPHQIEAVKDLKNGAILKGGVGTGKSRTALAYYFTKESGGRLRVNGRGNTEGFTSPKDLYIITTGKKRDSLEWQHEASHFGLGKHRNQSFGGVTVTIDSWNNILKYKEIKDAFFIFDEQRLVGSGTWVKAFLRIAKQNRWIVLSATPGDNWMDYIPVFVANGYYKNRTEFLRTHVVYNNFSKFPKVDHYVEVGTLERLRHDVLVEMPYQTHTTRHLENVLVEFNEQAFQRVYKDRWHIFEERPIKDISELFRVMRRLVNTDPSRVGALMQLMEKHPKLIVFYNFNYELEILRTLAQTVRIAYAEWNGQKHQEIPKQDSWLYLVQYTAGAEGWNCIETDSIVFWSLNYSYKIMEQAKGRIDRLNTPFIDLYYYVFRSSALIDRAIHKAIATKRVFNEGAMSKVLFGKAA